MRPVNRGPVPTHHNGEPKRYTEYGLARRDLIQRLGEFCSYCEMELDTSLAVEHIQPKEHRPHLELEWQNFLLACTNCNSTKDQRNPELTDILWPHQDNTFAALTYDEEGVVKPAPHLSPTQQAVAAATIALTGLAKVIDQQNASDRRWQNRRKAWHIAQESKQDLAEYDSEPMRRQIIRTVKSKGYWSIWMTVFADDADTRNRLIRALPGTATDCFDEQGQPLPHDGGQL